MQPAQVKPRLTGVQKDVGYYCIAFHMINENGAEEPSKSLSPSFSRVEELFVLVSAAGYFWPGKALWFFYSAHPTQHPTVFFQVPKEVSTDI